MTVKEPATHTFITEGDVTTLVCETPKGEIIHIKISTIDKELVGSVRNAWRVYEFGSKRNVVKQRYAATSVNGKLMLLHHLLMGKPDEGFCIDHKDGDGKNCVKINMQIVTRKQNRAKSQLRERPHTNSLSRIRNVWYHPEHQTHYAVVAGHYLGNFKDPHQAVKVVEAARAKLNFERWEQFKVA